MSKANIFAVAVIVIVVVGGGAALYKLDTGRGDRTSSVNGQNILAKTASD
jgi:hypothetical protein